ncbi:MAG TPA: transcriptional repressor LexA [Dissulfurispiraceae bacterium]|nr:transcriptional repressor LexA [Dissulfurispiraceae bacterium]
MKELTERQKSILEFVTTFVRARGYPPTVREIGTHFGILWAAARNHLQALERKGAIRLNPAKSRGIEVPGLIATGGLQIPVAGGIRAGRPVLATEEIDTHIIVDRELFPAEDAFSLRVSGESMKEAGILDGDFVIVRPQDHIGSGEIGVVLIGDEATVKRILITGGGEIILKPENREMEPVVYRADDVRVLGKVVGVVRKIS